VRRHAALWQRYRCKACASRFDDLADTVLAGHHQPLRVWVLCFYFMGLNLSNERGSARLLWRKKRLGV
jgi:transposase-like protein